MKVQEPIAYVKELLEPAFSNGILLRWLNQVETEIQVEVFSVAAEDTIRYTDSDMDRELIAPRPFDKLYEDYLIWRVALAQGEMERANNLQVIYNESYLAYVRFVCRSNDRRVTK